MTDAASMAAQPASTAFPPCSSSRKPASAASGVPAATAPRLPLTTGRNVSASGNPTLPRMNTSVARMEKLVAKVLIDLLLSHAGVCSQGPPQIDQPFNGENYQSSVQDPGPGLPVRSVRFHGTFDLAASAAERIAWPCI